MVVFIDINDCATRPCYNGGTCIDGNNWYLCRCAAGFSGPDCRININECASSPCAEGATCTDQIGSYRCDCPAGKQGRNCEGKNEIQQLSAQRGNFYFFLSHFVTTFHLCFLHLVLSAESIGNPMYCEYPKFDAIYRHNATFDDECNTCKCFKGTVTCTKVVCGPHNCLNKSGPGQSSSVRSCPIGNVCKRKETSCLKPPCKPWGECAGVLSAVSADSISDEVCLPNGTELSLDCAKINIIFDVKKLPRVRIFFKK